MVQLCVFMPKTRQFYNLPKHLFLADAAVAPAFKFVQLALGMNNCISGLRISEYLLLPTITWHYSDTKSVFLLVIKCSNMDFF